MSQETAGVGEIADELRAARSVEATLGAPLARLTTLRIGGAAEVLVRARDEAGLSAALEIVRRHQLGFQLIGMGSNLLVPDSGLRGVTVCLTGDFRETRVEDGQVRAGAGVSLARLARTLATQGLTGLEAFSGFPSTVGGAVVMNAGCYGVEIQDVLVSTTTVDRDGRSRKYSPSELEAGYRTTVLQGSGEVVTEAIFRVGAGDGKASLARIDELNRRRWASLPSGLPNAGSIFRNPEGDYAGRLIEAAGLKGACRGAAQISEKHANVIVNRGGARADDVLGLMIDVRGEVLRTAGLGLEPEIVLSGSLRCEWSRRVAHNERLATGPEGANG
ncbi:MAG: UDP-N-acetylmuramate dehydrogenase [Acidobacteriota bacterium]|nr:UDP-N-acetylmuramate dehydrogenase [Acidobacteriota bacterium]